MIEYSTPKILANPVDQDVQLTREQLWQAMLWKARYPTLFVAPIKQCTVLEEFDDGLLRELVHQDSVGTDIIHERIFLEPMSRVTFLRLKGGVQGQILNDIETNDDGALTLRFSFTLALPGAEHRGPEETAYEREFADGYVKAVNATLAATREWVRTGVDPTVALEEERKEAAAQ